VEPERWQRIESLFHAASQLTPAERTAFLDDSCGGDTALRSEVESLLTWHTSADRFIERPALDVAAKLMTAEDLARAGPSRSGTTIAGFQILQKLGEGGMGIVYEAIDTRLGRKVALKFLPDTVTAHSRAVERFEREARAASALNHPNICTIHSVQDHDGRPFIEMECLGGQTLRERIAGRPMEIDDVVPLALQIIDGLEAAHARGIVHRDLKPGNVFCTERGVAKILDFGIAKLDSGPDAEDGVVGTVSYMSPEQASGQAVDSRTDLFSLGALVYEMATGRAAFHGPSSAAIRQAILHGDPIPPRQVNPRMPVALERIILKALRKDRDLRYQRASELRVDLERLQQQGARGRQHRLGAAVLLLLLLAGSAAFWYWPRSDDMFDGGNLRLRQLTHNATAYSVTSGVISPDGRYVAYTDPRGIHVLATATGETRKVPPPGDLPGNGRWDLTPGWLPDGTRFVVNALAADSAAGSNVWMVGLSGPPRLLREHAEGLSVSPDGSWIAFGLEGRQKAYRSVWLMSLDGTGARKFFDVNAASAVTDLAWSPDGRRVAYLRADATGAFAAIETRDLAGGPPSTIFRAVDPEALLGLAWLRDGRLLYSLWRSTTSAGTVPCTHWQVRIDGTTGRPLSASNRLAGWLPQCVGPLSLTADGKRASFLQWAFEDAIQVADLDADGSRIASSGRLTFTEGRNIPSGWTSDNRSVVFVSDSDSGGRPTIVRQPIDSDTAQPIAEEPGIVGAARLTPDGASVIYLVAPTRRVSTGTQRLMRVPIAGGASREVVSGRFIDGGARCTVLPARLCAIAERSGNGRQLVFTSIDVPGGRGHELARVDADADGDYRWALSPDGARIAVLNVVGGRIHVLSLTGTSPVDVEIKGSNTLGYVSWTSDGTRLLVPSVDARMATLLSVDLQGNARVLWQQPGAIDISGIPSPDGRHVAVWIRSRKSNLWLAERP
jgi:Tol biopolymer transport system component